MKKLNGILSVIVGLALLGALGVGLAAVLQNATSGGRPGAAGYLPPAQVLQAMPLPAQTMQGYPPPLPTVPQTPYPTENVSTSEEPTPALLPFSDTPEQFDPRTYGLPQIIAGYKVLAISTSENTACTPAGEKSLVLQVTDPAVKDILKNVQPTEITTAMEAVGLKQGEWTFEIVGADATLDGIVANIQKWNKDAMKPNGCKPSGGPVRLTAMPMTTQDQNP